MNIGGAETLVKDYALLSNREQFSLKIISIDKEYYSANEKILNENGIEVIHLSDILYSPDKQLNIIEKILRSISRYFYFRKIIVLEKPDIIHLHLDTIHYLKVLPLRKMKIRLFYTVHNIPERFFSIKKQDRKKYKLYCDVKNYINKYNMRLIALHDTMNQELQELFHTKNVYTVHNGISLSRFNKKLYDKDKTKCSYGLEENDFVVGHVGRFDVQKNHEKIISVFRELLQIKPNAKLLLTGGGPLKDHIIDQLEHWNIKENVIILENRSDIPALMSAMDVFLFPSRWEGFGNVLIEAQSMDVDCVVSDCIPDDAIVSNFVKVLSLNADNKEWGQALLSPTKEHQYKDCFYEYDIEQSVRRLEKVYEL